MDIKQAHKALKEAEARLADDNLPPFVLDELLHRTLNDFTDAVLPSGRYANITEQCRAALRAQDYVEFISGISLLRLMLPRPSYGEIADGTRFYLGDLPSVVFIKRPGGVELNGRLYPRARDCETVILIESVKGEKQ